MVLSSVPGPKALSRRRHVDLGGGERFESFVCRLFVVSVFIEGFVFGVVRFKFLGVAGQECRWSRRIGLCPRILQPGLAKAPNNR